ncbi:eukaryotic translation initiation factor 2 subunit 2 [Octopus bimaculoides]|uniref:Eukaryotic translation initiation factor 2 subunit 2 n=1 Tax=Octopus bimaculoides TaxID=37653 RepID=A0A0L8GP44_OCTBM|nr:eukaryotic translation initiation factor 2 subunit 2 [Octopus bimaculoides]|eukprot:XP_014779264.1 PREDICTED: eukaryotic translation initiation factor 2 subunit 2-like [Octopus bimaculoides]
MADDEVLPFDPSLKKKKKKKKTPFMESSEMDGTRMDAPAADGTPSESTHDQTEGDIDLLCDKLDQDFSLELTKKKKKKKKPTDLDEQPDSAPETAKDSNEFDVGDPIQNDDDDLNLSLPRRKKKKKKKVINLDEQAEEEEMADDDDDEEIGRSKAWYGSDRDYTYDELLTRVFDIIREKNPDMVAGEKKRFVMKLPQVLRVGTKKTSFANFSEICRLLHREPKHVLAFLLAELGTSGSIDGNNQLIIKGRFQQKQIETVVRKYIKEYVTCHTCRSPETLLQKDTRLFFLQCETCGSRCSVTSIKSGFQAVTGKRAAIRAKNA